MKKTSSSAAFILAIFLHIFTSGSICAQEIVSSSFYFQKGIEEKTAKRWLVASSCFDSAIKLDPSYKEAYIESGYVNLEMRKTDRAMLQFNKVLELDPSNPFAVKELMELYYNYRQFAKAKEMANRCTGCLNAEKIKAMCSYNEADYGTAVKELTSYLAKNAGDADAVYALARSYFDMEDYKNAIPHYNKAILLNGEKNSWMYELGFLYFNARDYKNAVVFFKTAIEKGYPRNSSLDEYLGFSCIYSGQGGEGEKLLLGLLEKEPYNKQLLFDIAEAFYKAGMFQKSLDYCKTLRPDNQDAKALYLAGLCYKKLGEKQKGEGMCDQAIAMDGSLNRLRQRIEL